MPVDGLYTGKPDVFDRLTKGAVTAMPDGTIRQNDTDTLMFVVIWITTTLAGQLATVYVSDTAGENPPTTLLSEMVTPVAANKNYTVFFAVPSGDYYKIVWGTGVTSAYTQEFKRA